MILYHGSGTIVAEPIIVPSQKLCDFGPGFYTTNDEVKAWERAQSVIKHREAFIKLMARKLSTFKCCRGIAT